MFIPGKGRKRSSLARWKEGKIRIVGRRKGKLQLARGHAGEEVTILSVTEVRKGGGKKLD